MVEIQKPKSALKTPSVKRETVVVNNSAPMKKVTLVAKDEVSTHQQTSSYCCVRCQVSSQRRQASGEMWSSERVSPRRVESADIPCWAFTYALHTCAHQPAALPPPATHFAAFVCQFSSLYTYSLWLADTKNLLCAVVVIAAGLTLIFSFASVIHCLVNFLLPHIQILFEAFIFACSVGRFHGWRRARTHTKRHMRTETELKDAYIRSIGVLEQKRIENIFFWHWVALFKEVFL